MAFALYLRPSHRDAMVRRLPDAFAAAARFSDAGRRCGVLPGSWLCRRRIAPSAVDLHEASAAEGPPRALGEVCRRDRVSGGSRGLSLAGGGMAEFDTKSDGA